MTMAGVATDKPVVLVVEDDVETQKFMSAALRNAYTPLLASTGEEARRRVADHGSEIRLIIMDLSLKGGEDGLALTQELRRQGFARPIVALTAHALPEDRTNALAAGCDLYVAKPIDHRELVSIIARLIASRNG
jgi:CheY-like chemotaxis protein